MNLRKKHWRKLYMGQLLDLLNNEKSELVRAVYALENYSLSATKKDFENVINEAADVANFAMMIADKARESDTAQKASESNAKTH